MLEKKNDKTVIAITGEGPTDYGIREFAGEWLWGPVGIYVLKIADSFGKNIGLVPIERKEVEAVVLGRSAERLNGKAAPARRFYIAVKKRGIGFGIYYSDTDKIAGTRNTGLDAERSWKQRYDEITEGLCNDMYHFIPMVPLRMIENWILADRDALENVGGSVGYYFDKKPEMLWGDEHNPESNYPKRVLDRVFNSMKKKPKDRGRTFYVNVSEKQKLEVLLERCPISFKVFYDDLTRILNTQDT